MRAIDADALIEKYGDWYTEEGTEEGYIGTIKGIVNRMSTIEPERKTDGDTISRQAAIDEITEYGSGDTIYMSVAELKRRIEHLPHVQPEIIRCQDCKYVSPNGVYGCRLERFSAHDEGTRLFADDYCSKAERRTDTDG